MALIITPHGVRPLDAEVWLHYLHGLWYSGLRLEESIRLAWDDEALLSIDMSGRRPRFRIQAAGEKGRRDRLLPMPPEFAEMIDETPVAERIGPVFKLRGLQTGTRMTPGRIGRVVSEIGKRAGVVVNKAEGKYASAHDLRRSFGTRWAGRVKPATLQLLMRHESIETTMKYYVAQDSDEVADELWAAYDKKSTKPGRRQAQELRNS